ncbi:hypothetical protein BDR26DRAFT_817945 [Obelidium mucronatum]|nr:hypothetical protein BDR26DRAFT_817945 [Obelidium mucronatum]
MPRLFISNSKNTVSIITQTLPSTIAGEDSVVGDVIVAIRESHLLQLGLLSQVGPLSLHLPDGLALPPLSGDKMDDRVNADGSLRSGLLLSELGLVGRDDRKPLIIKAETQMDVDVAALQPPRRSPSGDKFILDNGLNLNEPEDAITFLRHRFDKLSQFKPGKPNLAEFPQNCLEGFLMIRRTDYTLDDIDNIKVLLAVSGSGKTRQLLELLYIQHGFYFVVGPQIADFGSADLAKCHEMSLYSPERAQDLIELLYFVRAFVCGRLLDCGLDRPDQVLLAQVHPVAFFGVDIFSELFDSLASRKVRVGPGWRGMKGAFDFLVIDEIQHSLLSEPVFKRPGSPSGRPFFSPLLYYSKRFFRNFIVAGTWINFQFMSEMVFPGAFKSNQIYFFKVISKLRPLDALQAETFIRQMLGQTLAVKEVQNIVDSVTTNKLFLGRGRFVAFVLDWVLEGKPIDCAIADFVMAISIPNGIMFPLKYYVEDVSQGKGSFPRSVNRTTLEPIICKGVVQYLFTGKGILHMQNNDASDAIQYGLGFCYVGNDMISFLTLEELAVVGCLRYLIPVSDIVSEICLQLASCPKPQMVGYILEYLVAYAFVVGLDPTKGKTLKSKYGDFLEYMTSQDEDQVFFPDQCCGPDIVFIFNGVVNMIQIKFVDKISKQERVNACHTTDFNFFYWNKKSKKVLAGFEKRQKDLVELLQTKSIKRFVFLHTTTQTTEGMEGVEVLNETTRPDFFDCLGMPGWWLKLNQIQKNCAE